MSLNLDEGKKNLSFDISNRRPKKITTMKPEDAERHSPEAKSLHKKAQAAVSLPKIKTEAKDHEHSMARSEIHKIDNAIKTLRKKVKGEGNLEAWVQSKITRAADYLDAVSNYLDSGEHNHVEESFDDNVPELRSRTVTNAPSSTSSSTKKRKSPGELMRMLNQANPPTTEPEPKKKKKKKKLKEETMTPEQKSKEEALKKKYDDSEMKQNMIDQYGKERGTQIYFAKIRKLAMEEGFIDPEDEIPTSTGKPGRKPIENVASHPNPRVRKKAVEAMRKQMEKEYGGKWKTRSKDPAMEEDINYDEWLDEAKLSRTARRAARAGRKGYDAEGNPVQRTPRTLTIQDLDNAALKEVGKKRRRNPETGKKETVKVEPAKINVVKDGNVVDQVPTKDFHHYNFPPDTKPEFKPLRNAQTFVDTTRVNKHVLNSAKKTNVELNTARGAFNNNKKVIRHLSNLGFNRRNRIKLQPGHFTGDIPGTGSPRKKLIATIHDINKYIPKKTKMSDDDPENLKPLETHRKDTQGPRGQTRGSAPKIHTQLVGSFAKRGEKRKPNRTHGRVRRYSDVRKPGTVTQPKTTKQNQRAGKTAKRGMVSGSLDYDLLYDFLLEQLIVEEIAESYEDASIIIDSLDDELLEDLVYQGYEFIHSVLEEETIMQEEMRPRIDYVSPYKKIQEKREIKKDYLSEELELTPYEYWKSFIGDTEEEIVSEEIEETEELVEEVEMTSYEKWKQFLT